MWFEVKSTGDLRAATQTLCKQLEDNLVPHEKVFDCRLVVNELVGNVLRHSDGYATMNSVVADGCVEIYVRSNQATDTFFPPENSVCSSPNAEGGRGLYLVDSVSVSRSVSPDGEIKVVIKY